MRLRGFKVNKHYDLLMGFNGQFKFSEVFEYLALKFLKTSYVYMYTHSVYNSGLRSVR